MDPPARYLVNATKVVVSGGPGNNTREFKEGLKPHPNVALYRHRGRNHYCGQEEFDAWDLFKETLDKNLSREKHSQKYYTTLMLQITHGLKHIHDDKVFHGHLSAQTIWISKGGQRALITDGKPLDQVPDECMRESYDIKCLHGVFSYIIEKNKTPDWRDMEIADDLLKKMQEGKYSAVEVLQHPFFWSEEKKVNFHVKTVTLIESSDRKEKLVKDINDARHVIENSPVHRNEKSWIKKLKLLSKEMTQWNEHYRKGLVTAWASTCSVSDATKSRKGKLLYNEESVYDILRFIRNYRIHLESRSERSNPLSNIFANETVDFWNFFSLRFPDLFITVYEIMRTTGSSLLNKSGVIETYVEEIAANKNLTVDNSTQN